MPEGIVAALMKYLEHSDGKVKSALIANAKDAGFDTQIDKFVAQYIRKRAPCLSDDEARELAKRYVLSEEFYHSTQPINMPPQKAEIDATETLRDYFSAKANSGEKSLEYTILADIADERIRQHRAQALAAVIIPTIAAHSAYRILRYRG